jgi:alkanesulfonate monooxygenase SsuD/methylene tetrahydromethanopterin reductase-like flavin-dependent oxidoreductase (luciferase family)
MSKEEPMRFGVHFQLSCAPGQSPVQRYQDTIEQAVAAEALGFDSVWPVEQHFDAEASILPAPHLLLAAIAARTTTLRLGTAVTILPLIHPVRAAEEIATLDVLSGGRVECGVGRGMDPAHFAGLGVSHAESYPRLEEGIEIVQRALREPRFSHHGRFHQLRDVTVVPRPVQLPHPPIRLAANSADTLELAGRLGLPILVATHVNPIPRLQELLPVYRQARHDAGHPDTSDDVTVLAPTYTGADEAAIRRDVEPGIAQVGAIVNRKLRTWMSALPTGPAGDPQRERLTQLMAAFKALDYTSMAETRAILDTPDGCVERLRALRDTLGTSRVICWFNMGGVTPHQRVLETMERFAEQVMPAFDSQSVAA